MKNLLTIAGASVLCLSSASVLADTTLYGKAHVAIQFEDDGTNSETTLESRASRFGVKGSKKLTDDLSAVYKWETEVKWDESDGADNGVQLKARNTYVGLKGSFGKILAGINDTPMKQAEGKIDLFSDREDIGNITKLYVDTQERENNFFGYYSPKFNNMQFAIATMEGKSDNELGNAWSTSLTYGDKKLKKTKFYGAIAYDQGVDGSEDATALRLAGATKFNDLTLGAILEQVEDDATDEQFRYFVSAAYKMDKKNKLLAQYGHADEALTTGTTTVAAQEASQLTLGWDHKLADATKIYITASQFELGDDTTDRYSVGLEHKF